MLWFDEKRKISELHACVVKRMCVHALLVCVCMRVKRDMRLRTYQLVSIKNCRISIHPVLKISSSDFFRLVFSFFSSFMSLSLRFSTFLGIEDNFFINLNAAFKVTGILICSGLMDCYAILTMFRHNRVSFLFGTKDYGEKPTSAGEPALVPVYANAQGLWRGGTSPATLLQK